MKGLKVIHQNPRPPQGVLDQLVDISAIRAAAAEAAYAAEGLNSDLKRRETFDAEVAERIQGRKAYLEYLYLKEKEAAARRQQTEYLSIGAKNWLDLVSMCEVGYLDFTRRRAEMQINADQNYVTSHPAIKNGAFWEKYLFEQSDAYESELSDSNLRWWTPTDDEYLGGPKHLHAIAQTWAKLRLLRTPLEFLDHGTRRIVAELRNEQLDAAAEHPAAFPGRLPSLSVVVPELANLDADTRAIAEHAIARECLASLKIKPPQGSDPHPYALCELRRYPELFCDAVRMGLQQAAAETASTDRTPSPSLGNTDFEAEDRFGERLLPRGDQKVVPLKRPAGISSVPQPTYFSLPWLDAITDIMEGVDRVSKALEEENGGKRSKQYEKLLLHKYFEVLGSPRTGSIGRSGYPEFIEKRVNRYLWTEQAFEAGKTVYRKGYPFPFTQREQREIQAKLLAAGVPKDGVRQLIGSLRKFVKRRSKRASQH